MTADRTTTERNQDEVATSRELAAEGIPDHVDPTPDDGFIVPGDEPRAALDYGTTAREAAVDEPLADRVRREQPESRPGSGGPAAAGRLEEPTANAGSPDKDVTGEQAGDDLGLSAEEEAVRLGSEPGGPS